MFVRLDFCLDAHFFLMDATMYLVITDTQHLAAVWIFAYPAFGGCFQYFFHGHSFGLDKPHLDLTEGFSQAPRPDFFNNRIISKMR